MFLFYLYTVLVSYLLRDRIVHVQAFGVSLPSRLGVATVLL